MRARAGRRAALVALAWVAWLAVGSGAAAAASPAAPPATPRTIEGTVTRVVDGDSLWLAREAGAPVEVRLHGIDAPEICQAGGREAKAALEEAARGRRVAVQVRGRDEHGRTLGVVQADGIELNRWLVAEGHAWSSRLRSDPGPYVREERMARSLRRGLHGQPGAVEPREFRRVHGPCGAAPPRRLDPPPAPTAPPAATGLQRRCDGRTRCSQMRSCEEATWFLQHCPGVEMDGDGDGVPCETQWCGR